MNSPPTTHPPPPPSYYRSTTTTTNTTLTHADFETSSIHSLAPSYHTTSTNLPDYAPPRRNTVSSPTSTSQQPLSLAFFAPPSTSLPHTTAHRNPTARHYHSVAHRRATLASLRDEAALLKASQAINPVAAVAALMSEREKEEFGDEETGEEGRRIRPLEDPDLVGVEAAERARRERRARLGDEVLVREDRRWEWMLAQMRDWEEREKSWGKWRREVDDRRRLGGGKGLVGRLGFGRGRK